MSTHQMIMTLKDLASGIGEHGIANANYRLAGILRREAEEIEQREKENE